jgi:thiamine biosynthesis lipoprotein ApbE
MKTVKVAAVISLFAGYLCAQAQQTDQFNIKTNETTWKGTLVDSACRSSHNDSQKSSRNTNRYTNTTKNLKNQFASNSTSYPGTTSTASYALITEDGKCIPFDLDSSEKVSGLLKIKKDWSENTVKINPTKVEVVGTENDNTIAVDEIRIK